MDAQVFVWENKERIFGEKLKKSLLHTLNKTPFRLEVLALYFVEKNSSERMGKTGSKSL